VRTKKPPIGSRSPVIETNLRADFNVGAECRLRRYRQSPSSSVHASVPG
jgi:hypothetical protein